MTEMEAWLWNSTVNTFVLPAEERVSAGLEQNVKMFKRAALVLDAYLARHDYLVVGRFTLTDIIVGWCVNSGRRQGHFGECPSLDPTAFPGSCSRSPTSRRPDRNDHPAPESTITCTPSSAFASAAQAARVSGMS
jgi:hypothetical protein